LALIEQAGINPSQVIIELTETQPVEDVQLMRQAMVHYREMGFRVALDDLGAGYSGLKLWSEIRPDIVKIDRHFIQGIDEDRTKQQFVHAILKTATALGARVITEGVETEREHATRYRKKNSCRHVFMTVVQFRKRRRNARSLYRPTIVP
jgi:EAL domain-containing protein (putative c-di-GMP-specific phosphodiesterase class I)